MIKIGLLFDFYEYDRTEKFRFGRLYLKTKEKHLIFQATSGLLGHQRIVDCGTRGKGGIPPCEFVGISTYSVSTHSIPMPNKRGIEGNFYQIFPYSNQVKINDGVYTRGDFGIHQDAGVKGTAGCIGITKGVHWKVFEIEMQSLVVQGVSSVELLVPGGY